MMPQTEAFRSYCQKCIHPFFFGGISVDPKLEGRYPDVDWDRLYSVIEDHIYRAGAPDGFVKVIVWERVWLEWGRNV